MEEPATNFSISVDRDRGRAATWVARASMPAFLPHFLEAQPPCDALDLSRPSWHARSSSRHPAVAPGRPRRTPQPSCRRRASTPSSPHLEFAPTHGSHRSPAPERRMCRCHLDGSRPCSHADSSLPPPSRQRTALPHSTLRGRGITVRSDAGTGSLPPGGPGRSDPLRQGRRWSGRPSARGDTPAPKVRGAARRPSRAPLRRGRDHRTA